MLNTAPFDCAINEKFCSVDGERGIWAGRRLNWLMHKDINTPMLSFWWAFNVVYMMFSWFNYVTDKHDLLAG